MTIVYFIIALGILVTVHEWGHYIVARFSGIRVEKFSIGFGPRLVSFHWRGTDFQIALIPLGGYVKLYGEDPIADSEGDMEKAQKIASSADSFSGASLRGRLATVFAGPAMNLILCLLLLPAVYFIGTIIFKKIPRDITRF